MKIVRHTQVQGFVINPYYSASINHSFDDVYLASDNIIRKLLKQIVLRWDTREGEIGKVLFFAFETTITIPIFFFFDKKITCTVKWEIQETFKNKARLKVDVITDKVEKKYYDSINAETVKLKNKLVNDFNQELIRIA